MSDIIQDVKVTPIPGKQKITLLLLNLVILCSGIAIGSSLTVMKLKDRLMPPNAPSPVMDHLERVAKEYSLTTEQKDKVKPVLEAYHETFKKMFSDSMQKMTTARETLVLDMKKVMTPEQYEKWYQDLLEQEKRRQRRRPPFDRRGGGRRDRGNRGDRGGPPKEWDSNRLPDANRMPPWRVRGERGRFEDPNGMSIEKNELNMD